MQPFFKPTIVSTYLIVNLLMFWNAQFYLECDTAFCTKLPLVLLWTVFFVTTASTTFLMQPKSLLRITIRFFVTCIQVLVGFGIYYNSADITTWGSARSFVDYSLPGILITLGFTAGLMIPENIVIKERKEK